jgi:hypothetical protein
LGIQRHQGRHLLVGGEHLDRAGGHWHAHRPDVDAGTLTIVGLAGQVSIALTMCQNLAFGKVQDVLELNLRNAINLVYGSNFQNILALQDLTGCKLDIPGVGRLSNWRDPARQLPTPGRRSLDGSVDFMMIFLIYQ